MPNVCLRITSFVTTAPSHQQDETTQDRTTWDDVKQGVQDHVERAEKMLGAEPPQESSQQEGNKDQDQVETDVHKFMEQSKQMISSEAPHSVGQK